MSLHAPTTSRRRVFAARTAAAAALLLPIGLLMGATSTDTDPDRLVMATAHWHNRAQLQKIAGNFQHLIIDEKRRTARVEATSDEIAALRRMGIRVEIDGEATDRMRRAEALIAKRAGLVKQQITPDGKLDLTQARLTAEAAIPGYACYRTVEETYATATALASKYPTRASVVDIGPSWTWADSNGAAGYRMRVLRLNNTATDATVPNKPNMVVIAAIHAREYTTAELVTRFAEWLANGYGNDAEATWLLDNFRFHFLLQSNPDGRKRAEAGQSWRKNTNDTDGSCSSTTYGVDLNRNFSWRFGTVPDGSSGDPCNVEFRGSAAVSENETANIMRYVVGTRGSDGTYSGGVLPDRRTDAGVAPADYRGMFLDIHSFSQLVLWPWAYTSTASPNMGPLRTLGRRMAYFNNYRPVQWTGLYAADGTNTDTIYGISGAPSYTIELGQEFFEDCPTFESTTFPRNFNALKYAARNLQLPYQSPGGPDVTTTGISAGSIAPGQPLAVSAWIDDGRYNQSNGTEPVQNVTSATAWVDRAPWASGAVAVTMRAYDGAFNSPRELAVVNIDTRNLSYGRHVVYVRGGDASGRPGTPSAVYFTVRRNTPLQDYDGNRRSDVFWRNSANGQNVIWRDANNATATVATGVTGAGWNVVAQGDFDGDGKSDVFWRNSATGANSIWRSGNAATPIAVATVPTSWRVGGAGDFDGDGKADVFWRNYSTGYNSIWRSGNSATAVAQARVGDVSWQVVGVGDFDGDARADVLFRHVHSGANSIWRSGSASNVQTLTVVPTAWKVAGIGDFDFNGQADIFWRNGGTGQNIIWRGGNSGSQIPVATLATSWRAAAIGDFDADGYADVLWRNASTGQNGIWKRANNAMPQNVATLAGSQWSVVPFEAQP